MLKQVHLYIKGNVIGVGFRAWVKLQAKNLNVFGWVKNVYHQPEIFGPGGGVEAVIQGEKEKVDKIVNLIKKGPMTGYVEEVEVVEQNPKEIFEAFEIR